MTAGSTGTGKGRGSARGTGKGGTRGGRRSPDASAAKRAPKTAAPASTKAQSRPKRPTTKAAPKSGPKKPAAKPASRKTSASRASASARPARPAWAVSGNGGARRAMGRGPGALSRRAMAGGAVLFAVGLVAGLRLRPESVDPPAPVAGAPVPPSLRRPGTVTLADVPDASVVRIDLPMAEGAAPDVLAAPAAPSRVVRPDETVLASRPPETAPVPGPKPAEGHQPAPPSNTPASAASEPLRIVPDPDPAPTTARVPASPRAPLWLANAMNVPHPGRRPMVAVVIDDLGLDRARTARVLSLPGPLTLSFMSYAKDLPGQAAAGRAFGHERMLHMPMQPGSADIDPGPGALYVGQSAAEIRRRLERALDAFSGYIGLNNHMGSRFTADAAGMRVVMDVARRRELLFLDSRTTGASVAPRLAAAAGVPFLERAVFLDHNPRRGAVDRQLAELERVATRHGHAVAIGHPRDATIAALAAWIEPARARGLALVPASAITRFARSV